MAVTNYYSINGQIIGESTSGVRTDYLTDALGSVTGTVNQSGVVINTYRYKPYDDLLSKTGTGSDPAFGWAGTQGYKQTQKKYSNFYVRARHYGSVQGRWTTVDPIGVNGGDVNFYRYVKSRVVHLIDNSGLRCSDDDCLDEKKVCQSFTKDCWRAVNKKANGGTVLGLTICCTDKNGVDHKYACTNPVLDEDLGNKPYRPLVKACVRFHEKQHVDQNTTCSAKYPGCPSVATSSGTDYDERECEAYKKQIYCLQEALSVACAFYPDPDACRRYILNNYADVCTTAKMIPGCNLKGYCK